MTNDEMRRRLAAAMGWTDLDTVSPCGRMRGLWGTEPAGWFAPGSPPRTGIIAPNPLESDRDAALLRAWCVERGWSVALNCYPEVAVVSVYGAENEFLAQARVEANADLRPTQRERLATSRAVVQAIEATEAQDEP